MTELEYFKGDDLAASVWRSKYALEGENNPDDMHRRLAREFARIEDKYNVAQLDRESCDALSNYGKVRRKLTRQSIYELVKDFKYVIPGGSVMAGLGSNKPVSLSNCFVIGSPEDSYVSIMKTRNDQVQLMKRRGGVGYDLSNLRPRGAKVNNAAGTSTGAASFMDVCSDITNEVAQNGRRGALMLTLSINHPDIEEFFMKKQDLTKVTGANISVKVTDEFMRAVVEDKDFVLRYPIDSVVGYQDINGVKALHYDGDNSAYVTYAAYNKLYKVGDGYLKLVKAKELWDKLIHCAHITAEPGIIFEDRMHEYAPDGVYEDYKVISTNPCGRQFCCK